MAQRKWIAKWSMGYVGTDNEEEIDLVDDWGYTEEEVEEMDDEEAQRLVDEYAWEAAIGYVEAYGKKLDKRIIISYITFINEIGLFVAGSKTPLDAVTSRGFSLFYLSMGFPLLSQTHW